MRCNHVIAIVFCLYGQALVVSEKVHSIASSVRSKEVSNRNESLRQPFGHGKSLCHFWESWAPTNHKWDQYLQKYNMALCRKNYGADGNCLFNSIAGILQAHGLKRSTIGFTLSHLPSALAASLVEYEFQQPYFTVADLRTISAMYFVGVNPYNTEALLLWDYSAFHTKMEVAADMEGFNDYRDVRWSPKRLYNDLLAGREPVSVAREVYNSLIQVRNPLSWGSYEDMVAISSVLSLDIYLLHSKETKVQLIQASHPTDGCYPSLLLYYVDMIHFDGAGLVYYSGNKQRPVLTSMFASNSFPRPLSALIEHRG